MYINKFIGSLFLLATFIFVSPALAGGGRISLEVNPSGFLPVGSKFTLKASVSDNNSDNPTYLPCKKCPITIKIENPKNGEQILQDDSMTDNEGNVRARFSSQDVGEKVIYVDMVLSDGITYASSKYVLNFAQSVPQGSISIKVDNQKSLGGNIRKVNLSWNSVQDALDYFVFAKPVNGSYGYALVDTRGLNGEITINTTPDYLVKVMACSSFGRCIESSEVRISAIKQESITTPTKTPVPTQSTPKPTINTKITVTPKKVEATSSGENEKIEKLNREVENLQNQLDESQKKQSILELRLNQILTWIKSVFPFFK